MTSELLERLNYRSGYSNLDSDVCQIALKMLWIHYLSASVISPSVVKLAGDCIRNAK